MNKPTKLEIITLISDYARKYHVSAISLGVEHEDAEISHASIVSALDRLFDQPHAECAIETKPDAPAKGFAEIRRDQVFEAINGERRYQEMKWGDLVDHPQSVGAYMTLMRVHLTRAENDWAGSDGNIEALHCLRKVLAIGVACGEQHGMPCRPDTAPTPHANPFSDDEHE